MDPNALAVDECENVSLHTAWASTFTSSGGSIQPSSAATDTVASLAADPARTNGYVELYVTSMAFSAGNYVGAALRIKASNQMYIAYIIGDGTIGIDRYNTGFTTLIASTAFPNLPFMLTADIAEQNIRLAINGTVRLSTTDATFTGPGAHGVYAYATSAAANAQIARWETGPYQGPPLRRRL